MCNSLNKNVEYHKLSKSFSCFKSLENFNSSIRQHLYNKSHLLTPSAVTVYKLLARYAVKFNGCAFLKVDNIATLTGYARRTVFKALALLERLEMVMRKNVMRPRKGGKGANLFIFQKYRKLEPMGQEKPVKTNKGMSVNAPRQVVETLEVSTENDEISDIEAEITLKPCNKDLIRIGTSPYDKFRSLVSKFTKDKNVLYKIYGVFKGQTKYLKDAYQEAEILNTALHALRVALYATKTKRIRNIAGYYNGVLSQCLDRLYYESIAEYVC